VPFIKHRDEREIYAFDFALRLVTAETLSAPAVKVTLRSGVTYVDKSAEFVTGSPAVSGTKVQFTLKPAALGTEQLPGTDYVIYAKADTSLGRILVDTTPLTVTQEATT